MKAAGCHDVRQAGVAIPPLTSLATRACSWAASLFGDGTINSSAEITIGSILGEQHVRKVPIVDIQSRLAPLRIGYIVSSQHRSLSMAKGTVKWFNPTKGYGFIQPSGGGGRDVFVHISAVEKAGLSTLNEGQTVEYEEVPNKGKTSAENLKVV